MAAHCEALGGIGWIFGHLIDGVQAELARVPYAETSVHAVPEGVTDEQVLFLADILPTGFEIGVQNGRVKPGDTVAVVGAGPVGLAAMMTGAIAGAAASSPSTREPSGSGTPSVAARRTPSTAGTRRARDPRAHRGPRRRRRDGGGRAPGDLRPLHADRARGRTVANIGVHGAPTTLHLEDLWIKNITITTGLVSGSTVPTLLQARARRADRAGEARHPPLRARRDRGGLRRVRRRGENDALKVVLTR
jgi:alcohol dehydrogenase